jgi:hypothetical protein
MRNSRGRYGRGGYRRNNYRSGGGYGRGYNRNPSYGYQQQPYGGFYGQPAYPQPYAYAQPYAAPFAQPLGAFPNALLGGAGFGMDEIISSEVAAAIEQKAQEKKDQQEKIAAHKKLDDLQKLIIASNKPKIEASIGTPNNELLHALGGAQMQNDNLQQALLLQNQQLQQRLAQAQQHANLANLKLASRKRSAELANLDAKAPPIIRPRIIADAVDEKVEEDEIDKIKDFDAPSALDDDIFAMAMILPKGLRDLIKEITKEDELKQPTARVFKNGASFKKEALINIAKKLNSKVLLITRN